MAKQIAFGVVWCVVFYFGLCMIVGAVAGEWRPRICNLAMTRTSSARWPRARGPSRTLADRRGAIFFAAAGSILEILPGTRVRRTRVIEIR